jgi:competence protein ComEC
MLAPLKRTKAWRWITTIIIISILWLFSLMTGAQPSIIRAALMCTIMLLAEVLSRRSNTLNSLACSAFVLLCFNPFDLWDVGFQLSYAGLLSLVLFTRPIYNLIYVENIIVRYVWQLVSATLAAQILTTPISIYHFHQFPFSFLLTNLLAVPLSGLILIAELALFVFSLVGPLAMIIGKLLTVTIWLMNTWVERIDGLQGMLWDGLQLSLVQAILLYLSIIGFAVWLLNAIKKAVWIGMASLVVFFVLRTYSFQQCKAQKQLIVYNIPKHHAVDIMEGRKICFAGDEDLMQDGFLQNFNIKPARTLYRMRSVQLINDGDENLSFSLNGKRIVMANAAIEDDSVIDVLILSKPVPLDFDSSLVKKVVLEGSISQWKAKGIKVALSQLHIPFHDVTTDGAFILNLK